MGMKTGQGQRAAIYARISDARDGDTAGVDRQVEDCQDLCDREGLQVVGIYRDNNRSAYRPGGKRPDYDRMLEAVRDGQVDVIVVYATDRLYRRLTDLEDLTATLNRGSRGVVLVKTVKSGEVDLSTADGVMQAGMLAVVAKHESMKRGERVARAARQRAEQGRFSGGVRRFGYNATMTELVPEEADAIAWAYRAVADGVTVREVWREWKRRGLRGTQGGAIAPSQVTLILRRPFNASLVSYRGELLPGKSDVPAIVDEDLWRTVNAILSDPARRTAPMGRPSVTLLAGLMTCGVCGGPMYRQNHHTAAAQRKVYTCQIGRHVSRSERVMEDGMNALMVTYLEGNAAKLRKPVKQVKSKSQDAAAKADALRRKLEDLSLLLASGDLDARDYARATKDVRQRLEALDAQVIADSARPATAALLKAGDVSAAWDAASIDTKRAVMKELLDAVVVGRTEIRGKSAGMDNVTVTWKEL